MKTIIEYKRFFAYSEDINKFFNTEFNPSINVIYGKNTSGKSTLIQAIQYTFGINDEKIKLDEVLSEKVIFRIDFILKNDGNENVTIIRNNDFIIVKRDNLPIKKFTGISGNTSFEHKELKKYIADLFNFTLYLENSGEYKPASIETIFLPYYIAQDVGWVYRHKSFRGLDFIKNFKSDFFDYYLGIVNEYDREAKQKLDNEKKQYSNEIKFLTETERKNDELQLSKLKDEKFILKAVDYLETYKTNKNKLIEYEKQYLLECNKLAYLEQRKNILTRVKTALKKQNPLENNCPTCNQNLPNSMEDIYEYFQDFNDTEKQLSEIDKLINDLKDTKGNINSLELKIQNYKNLVSLDYSVLNKYNVDDLTFNTWIDNKSNVQLSENIISQIGQITIKLNKTTEDLKAFKTDEEIIKERVNKDYHFKSYFENYLAELGVKKFENDTFLLLYKIPAFPKQGVELLKTLLAYNFAFNKIISETDYVHRLPFMLDAIFKEDIEDKNRASILEFIYKNKPKDTQIIMSIADSKDNQISASDYNINNLNSEAKLICIGDNVNERAFLSEYDNKYDKYLEETLSYLDEDIN